MKRLALVLLLGCAGLLTPALAKDTIIPVAEGVDHLQVYIKPSAYSKTQRTVRQKGGFGKGVIVVYRQGADGKDRKIDIRCIDCIPRRIDRALNVAQKTAGSVVVLSTTGGDTSERILGSTFSPAPAESSEASEEEPQQP